MLPLSTTTTDHAPFCFVRLATNHPTTQFPVITPQLHATPISPHEVSLPFTSRCPRRSPQNPHRDHSPPNIEYLTPNRFGRPRLAITNILRKHKFIGKQTSLQNGSNTARNENLIVKDNRTGIFAPSERPLDVATSDVMQSDSSNTSHTLWGTVTLIATGTGNELGQMKARNRVFDIPDQLDGTFLSYSLMMVCITLHAHFAKRCIVSRSLKAYRPKPSNIGELSQYRCWPQFNQRQIPTAGLKGIHQIDQIATTANGEPQGSEQRTHRAIFHPHRQSTSMQLVCDCRTPCP